MQAHEDFHDYNYMNRVDLRIQQIFAGQKIKSNKNISLFIDLVLVSQMYFSFQIKKSHIELTGLLVE